MQPSTHAHRGRLQLVSAPRRPPQVAAGLHCRRGSVGLSRTTLLLLNWVRATPDRPFMSYKSSSQTRLIRHSLMRSGRTRKLSLMRSGRTRKLYKYHPNWIPSQLHCERGSCQVPLYGRIVGGESPRHHAAARAPTDTGSPPASFAATLSKTSDTHAAVLAEASTNSMFWLQGLQKDGGARDMMGPAAAAVAVQQQQKKWAGLTTGL